MDAFDNEILASATPIQEGDLIAAVDLGSNSFHLVVARFTGGELRVIDRLRETVRLAAGLRSDGTLERAQRELAFSCLTRFAQRIKGLPGERVRAVATNTVRKLAHPQAFLMPAETALEHAIEVVSGREEARLIYEGVARGLPLSDAGRLVIDIGGGSTEFIIGHGFDAQETESLQVGCIASTRRFFPDGAITAARWKQAQREVGVELQQFAARYRDVGWQEVIGSSGTAKSIQAIVQENGWSDQGITPHSLQQLRDALLAAGHSERLNLPGLVADRIEIISGGVAILEAAFSTLGIERMDVCETAMREGLLYDMLGRAQNRDPRNASINALADRYAVDHAQARRVGRTAELLFGQVAERWQLDADARDLLDWCARVHEIGLAIAHSHHQVHGAYIMAQSDLAGFSRQEQQQLAAVLRSHRRKPNRESQSALPTRMQPTTQRVTALLRLAILLHRARGSETLPPMSISADGNELALQLPLAWLNQHPLTRTDLEQERKHLKQLNLSLRTVAVGPK